MIKPAAALVRSQRQSQLLTPPISSAGATRDARLRDSDATAAALCHSRAKRSGNPKRTSHSSCRVVIIGDHWLADGSTKVAVVTNH
eukprot:Skav203728  [mRNA]  locus=scaffold2895:66072:68660:- [translate_table: standard]